MSSDVAGGCQVRFEVAVGDFERFLLVGKGASAATQQCWHPCSSALTGPATRHTSRPRARATRRSTSGTDSAPRHPSPSRAARHCGRCGATQPDTGHQQDGRRQPVSAPHRSPRAFPA
jgi:hypothetical protein